FAPDGRTFITGSADGTVRIWETAGHTTQADVRPFHMRLGELAGGSGTAIFLSPDARHLMPVFPDKTFSLWEVPNLSEGPRRALPLTNFSCGALAPGGRLAAFVADDGNIVLCHTDTGETNWFGRPFTNDSNRAVFSSDGKRLAIANMGEEVCVMDVESKSK